MSDFYGPGYAGPLRTCQHCGGLQSLTPLEYNLHGGNYYFVRGNATLANGGTLQWSVETPSTPLLHMMHKITASGGMTVTVQEDITDITGGATVTPINAKRGSANVSAATILANPTVTDGDVLETTAGDMERTRPLILKPSAAYLWRIVSGADNNIINYLGHWYEHTDLSQ
jgi:hypothetical protein